MISTTNLLELIAFINNKHGDQKYGIYPYSKHLYDVLNNAIKYMSELPDEYYTSNNLFIIAGSAYAHDVLEDTYCRISDLEKMTNIGCNKDEINIVDIVLNVTKYKTELLEDYYAKVARHKLSIYIKLCDRIANVTENKLTGNIEKFTKYYNTNKIFEKYCRNKDEFEKMWQDLNNLLVMTDR